jgi:hypothetical protein
VRSKGTDGFENSRVELPMVGSCDVKLVRLLIKIRYLHFLI